MVHSIAVDDDVVTGRHGAIPIRRYTPAHPVGRVPMLWLHGGAFSHGDLDMPESDAPARAIALTGRPVIAVDYRRVPPWSWWRAPKPGRLPGVRYPIPADDVMDALEHIQAESSGSAVVLGGASAGACLAAAASLRAQAEKRSMPAGLVLAYGTFHAQLPTIPQELRSRIRGRHSVVQFRAGTVNKMNRNYAGSVTAMGDPFAFPGGHDLRGTPPTLVLDADRDSLRASGQQFAMELQRAGTEVDHQVVHDSSHGFLNRPDTVPFADGIARMVSWMLRVA